MLKKPIALIGLGRSTRSAQKLLLARGYAPADLLTYDDKNMEAQFCDPVELLKNKPQTFVVSPGFPLQTPWLQKALDTGVHLTSELTLAFDGLDTEKVIAITGSIGKSTCTSLIGEALEASGQSAFVGGNLGTPLADYALEKKQTQKKVDWVVLELSSYQLENFENLRADASVLTYFEPNHLDRYSSVDSYFSQKWTLVQKTNGPILANQKSEHLRKFARRHPIELIWVSPENPEFPKEIFQNARLLGTHNLQNLALAWRLGQELGWSENFLRGLLHFPGLPHRLENLGVFGGVQFINDSKATTMASVLEAAKSVQNLVSNRLILLLGGRDKNLPWHELQTLGQSKCQFVFFGEVAIKAQQASQLPGLSFPSLKEALPATLSVLCPGDVVLLSPGGVSYDEFVSFEARGNYFKEKISEYAASLTR